jgi:acyl carrier protein
MKRLGGNTMVLEKVKVILAEQFDVDEDSLQNDTDLQDDLGADSLDVVDLLMSIEDEFEIEIPDEEIENIRTVGELVNYIENNM